jgi:hypothetical protein
VGKFEGYSPSDIPLLITPIVLTLIAVAMVVLTLRYLISSARLPLTSIPQTCRYKRDQLKYLAILSVATGMIGTLYRVKHIFTKLGASGGDVLDNGIGAVGEALGPFGLSLFVFMLGVVCMIAVLERSSRLIASKRS